MRSTTVPISDITRVVTNLVWPVASGSDTGAQSVRITLEGTSLTKVVNRIGSASYRESITFDGATPGTFPIRFEYFTGKDGAGTHLGTLAGNVTVAKGATVTDPGIVVGYIKPTSVRFLPVGNLAVDATIPVTLDARDASNVRIGVDPTKVALTSSDPAKLSISGLTIRGLAEGMATLSGSVDGINIPPIVVTITPRGTGSIDPGIVITPFTVSVEVGKTVKFTASESVDWSVVEAGGGTIDATGLYTAPNTVGNFQVKATRKSDNKFNTAQVTVTPPTTPPPTSTPTLAIKVNGNDLDTTKIRVSGSLTLDAVVTNAPNDSGINWTIDKGATGGTIEVKSLRQAIYKASQQSGTYIITAQTQFANSKGERGRDSITVVVEGGVVITISPKEISVLPGTEVTVTATVEGSDNKTVLFTLPDGSIVTRPDGKVSYKTSTDTSGRFVEIRATPQADTSKVEKTTIITYRTDISAISFLLSGDGKLYILDSRRIVRMQDMSGTAFTELTRPARLNDWTIGPNGKVYSVSGIGISQFDDVIGTNAQTFENSDMFSSLEQVSIGPDGKIYVVDSSGGRIWRMDDISGRNLVSFGNKGKGQNQFSGPVGIYVDPNGGIFVADNGNNRIVRISDMNGTDWTTYDAFSGTVKFVPGRLFGDRSGRIYCTDRSIIGGIVRMNDIKGTGILRFGKSGSGTGTGVFGTLASVQFDSQNRIYISDFGKSRVVRMDDMTGAGWTAFPR